MPDIRLPEATLIDIKRISKDYQKKWQARINYSELFDIAKKEKNIMLLHLLLLTTNIL